MSASDHLQPRQLTLFERAGDLVDPTKFNHADRFPYITAKSTLDPLFGDYESMAKTKVKESKAWDAHPEEVDESTLADPDGPVLRRKEHPSLRQDIKRRGVQTPINISFDPQEDVEDRSIPTISNGHHRIFAANDINPDMEVPVSWGPTDWQLQWGKDYGTRT
jgi:hypothetical protein